MSGDFSNEKLRLDKWLWAARFFKTRSLAKAAIEGGKVHLGGQRVKVSKEIAVGDTLQIRQGYDEKVVEIKAEIRYFISPIRLVVIDSHLSTFFALF